MRSQALTAVLVLTAASGTARAADLFAAEPATLLRSETFTAEAFAGYLSTTSRAQVYGAAAGGQRIARLDVGSDSVALGGRVAFRPVEWLTIRARGWSTVAGSSDASLYGWFRNEYDASRWSDRLIGQADTTKAWQGDVSAAVSFYDLGDVAFSGIGGYRYLSMKSKAEGGSYISSSALGFRDLSGPVPAGSLAGAYEQTWQTPYLGLGVSTNSGDWSFSGEIVGSPFVIADAKAQAATSGPALTALLGSPQALTARGKFGLSGMVGASASAEYRITPLLALTGRVEYQNYLGAKGGVRVADGNTGLVSYAARPAIQAEAETLLVTVGVKARM